MISWLTGKMAAYGAAIVGFLGFIAMVFLKGKKAARQEIAAKTTETVLEVTKDAKQVREQVQRDGPDDARDRMRERLDRNKS